MRFLVFYRRSITEDACIEVEADSQEDIQDAIWADEFNQNREVEDVEIDDIISMEAEEKAEDYFQKDEDWGPDEMGDVRILDLDLADEEL